MEPVQEQSIVGIDVSKRTVDVAISTTSGSRSYPNSGPGFTALIAEIAVMPRALIVLEATGEYHIPLVEALEAAGYLTAICHPGHVRAYVRSMGMRSKTDRIDACMLVAFGSARRPVARPLGAPQLRHLQALLARRDDLMTMRTMESNRHHATHDQVIAASLGQMIAILTAHIQQLDRAIAELIASEPALTRRSTQLQTVPGIGPHVAARCLACLPALGTMTAKQLAALVGVAPYARDSGQFHGKRFIQGGKATLRQTLYLAINSTVHCTRSANALKTHYTHLRHLGKPHNVAMIATIRRLLTYLTVMTRDHLTWEQLDINQRAPAALAA